VSLHAIRRVVSPRLASAPSCLAGIPFITLHRSHQCRPVWSRSRSEEGGAMLSPRCPPRRHRHRLLCHHRRWFLGKASSSSCLLATFPSRVIAERGCIYASSIAFMWYSKSSSNVCRQYGNVEVPSSQRCSLDGKRSCNVCTQPRVARYPGPGDAPCRYCIRAALVEVVVPSS
jgi:hypothetical protein